MGAKESALASAERLLKQGRVDAAMAELQTLARKAPKDVTVLNRIGDLLARQGRHEQAVGFYDRIAEEFAQSGFIPKAVAIYKKILRLFPDRTETLFQLGTLFLRQDLAGEARGHLLKAAEQYLQSKQFDRARDVYEQLAAAEPQDARHRVRLAETLAAGGNVAEAVNALVDVGRSLLRDGEPDQAEQAYRRAGELNGDNAGCIVGVAGCMKARGEVDAAVAHVEEHAGRRPEDAMLAGQAALFFLDVGRGERAAELLMGACAGDIPEPVFVEVFRRHVDEKGLDELWTRFDPLLDRWASDGARARVTSLLGHLVEIESDGHVQALERLLELEEGNGDAGGVEEILARLARAYEARALPERAAEIRRRLPRQPAAQHGPAAAAAQAPAQAAPEPEAAVTPTDTSAAEAPAVPLNRSDEEFVTGRVTQAEILEKYGLHDQAREQLREVTERFPGHVDTQERYVRLLQGTGAEADLRDALVALALARRAAGDADGAREAVRQAKQQAPLESATRALLQELGLDGAQAAPGPPPAVAPADAEAGDAADDGDFVIEFDADEAPAAAAAPATEAPGPAAPADKEPSAAAGLESALDESVLSVPEDDDDDLSAITAALEDQLFEEDDDEAATQPESEESLEDVFAAFRRHVEEEVGDEDHRTHYDLGIAYKEMGLLNEAIHEFRISAAAPDLKRDSVSMLALCHRENGDLAQAASWYRQAIGEGQQDDAIARSLRYDLADVLVLTGDAAGALDLYRAVLEADPSFRDVRAKVSELEARLGS
jgi:tetratricopeptide (TPR) repeat protein